MSTFFVTDERMLKHKCEWDHTHIERPDRLKWILNKLRKTDLLDRCTRLESRLATEEELQLVHSKDYITRIKATKDMAVEEQEQFCSGYEDIYLNSCSLEAALLSAGCALELTEAVLRGGGKTSANGFAAIRPPGHHASRDQACGFCVFNNVAICAKQAISSGLKRVLIVDWDVHAGQGTQYAIEDDPSIRLVSIHRYDEGEFWPQLPESAIVNRYANTLNVPLNAIGHEDNDYMTIVSTLVLPLIYSWKPELIMVSCGFDAAVGDSEGEMLVTPSGFAGMTGLLAAQNIPLVVLLEGGYFLESIGESTNAVLRALIERTPPAMFVDELGPSSSLLEQLAHSLCAYQSMLGFDPVECVNAVRQRKKLPCIGRFERNEYKGEREFSLPYTTRNLYTPRPTEVEEGFVKKLHEMIIRRTDTERQNIKLSLGRKPIELTMHGKTYKLHVKGLADVSFVFYFILLALSIKYRLVTDPAKWSYNFTHFAARFDVSGTSNRTITERLADDIAQLPEKFGFW